MKTSAQKIVTIIGFGNVGRAIAHLLINMDDAEFIINVIDPSPAIHGSLLDLGHASFLTNKHRFVENSSELLNSSEFIFHSAGKGVPPGSSRLDLADQNCALTYTIFKDYTPTVDAKIIVITNPVDNVTYHTYKATGLNTSKVIGTGTLLDSLRMNYYLSNLKPAVNSLNTILIGEHGASIVIADSLSNANGQSLLTHFSKEEIQSCLQRTIMSASEIKKTQGASIYGAADCAVYIMRQILNDTGVIHPVSVLLPDYLSEIMGCGELYMSVPSKIDANGAEAVNALVLDDSEWQLLIDSAKVIRNSQ